MPGIMDIVSALGRGVVHGQNVATRGGDYLQQDEKLKMEQRRLAAQLAAEEITRRFNLGQVKEQDLGMEAEAAEATMAGQPGVPQLRASRSIEDRARQAAASEAALGSVGADIDLKGSQANFYDQRPTIEANKLGQRVEDKNQDQARQAALTAAMIANLQSMTADREATRPSRTARGSGQGDTLNAESFPQWWKLATEEAMLNLPPGQDQPTLEQINAALQRMLSGYQGVAQGSRTGAPAAPPGAGSTSMPGVVRGASSSASAPAPAASQNLYEFQGQKYTWDQLPENLKAKARAKGAAPPGR